MFLLVVNFARLTVIGILIFVGRLFYDHRYKTIILFFLLQDKFGLMSEPDRLCIQ